MNQHSRIVNRRNFLKTTAGLSLALTIAPDALSLIDAFDPRRVRILTTLAAHLMHHEDRPRRVEPGVAAAR